MDIEEAIKSVETASDDTALVVKPPLAWGAEAAFVKLTDDYRVPKEIQDNGFVSGARTHLIGRSGLSRAAGGARADPAPPVQ